MILENMFYGSKGGVSPSGTVEITENGTYDVSDKASAVVAVPQQGLTWEDIMRRTYSYDVVIPNTAGTKLIIPAYAFEHNNYIRSVRFDGECEIGDYTFDNATQLAQLIMPNLKKLGGYSLRQTQITAVDFPNLETVGNNAFYMATQIQNVYLPALKTIGTDVFNNCSGLLTAKLPKINGFRGSLFNWCRYMTLCDLGGQEESIDPTSGQSQYVFNQCQALTSLILRFSSVVPIGSNSFNGTPIASGTGYIYVPSALLADYQAATNWSTYSAQFRALEDYTLDGTTTGELDPTKI